MAQYSCAFCTGADCATVITYAERQPDGALAPRSQTLVDGAKLTCGNQGGTFMTYPLPSSSPTGPHLSGVTQIAAGGNYACAIRADKTVKCWGSFSLTSGTEGDPSSLDSVSFVAVGDGFACAVKADGTVWCWGIDFQGQLGDQNIGGGRVSTTPIQVPGITHARSLALGDNHACALLSDGTVMCWGAALLGQLGIGPTPLSLIVGGPTAVSGLVGVTSITAAGAETCALLTDGMIECWGGRGVISATDLPSPTKIGGIDNVNSISLSAAALCALLDDKTVQCWNASESGNAAGIGTTPVTMPGTAAVIKGLSAVSVLEQGDASACALQAGLVNCWGFVTVGSAVGRMPEVVPGVSGATSLALGLGFTCAIVADGAVMCWGGNTRGQLGDGTSQSSTSPVYVLP
ncbi:MAG TPA: hypothetical protein VHU40_07015 [Polyangia bacterium]|nr:hypothetical protein [Polyangia bacterium]